MLFPVATFLNVKEVVFFFQLLLLKHWQSKS